MITLGFKTFFKIETVHFNLEKTINLVYIISLYEIQNGKYTPIIDSREHEVST